MNAKEKEGLIEKVRRCGRLIDDIGAAAAFRALMAIDPNAAALVAAEVFGNNTDWLRESSTRDACEGTNDE